ncbi:MAG: LURP-one-related family protein [Clostridia bacterium]|nr:LURP-one-related family protein [Clostridia bacterium]
MQLYIKQKVFAMSPKFTIKDETGEDKYFVEGEFFSLSSKMHIYNSAHEEIALIYRKLMKFLPRFVLEVNGQQIAEIVKEVTFFKQSYTLENTTLHVEGDFLAHEYSLFDSGRKVMDIHKEWLTWGDSYVLDILDPAYELISLGVVLAIDTVMQSNKN